jgi:hypothetical protein
MGIGTFPDSAPCIQDGFLPSSRLPRGEMKVREQAAEILFPLPAGELVGPTARSAPFPTGYRRADAIDSTPPQAGIGERCSLLLAVIV